MPILIRIFMTLVVFLAAVPSTLFAAETGDKHFLWKVESESTSGYLFGSVHAGDESLYPLSPVIEEAFEASDLLIIEADVFSISPAEMQTLTLSKALYTDGRTLPEMLSNDQMKKLRTKLKEYGLTADRFSMFRPWFVAITITALGLKDLGISEEYGIDRYFYQKAEGNKDIQGLETPRFQIELFAGMSEEEQLLMLEYSFEEIENLEESFDKMLNSWRTGDVDELEEILLKTRREEPRLERLFRVLFDDRNFSMSDSLEVYLGQGRPFFAVIGAGHLVGEVGIIEILKDRGYSLEQL